MSGRLHGPRGTGFPWPFTLNSPPISTVQHVPQVELEDHSSVGHTNGSTVTPIDDVTRLEAEITEVTELLVTARHHAATHDPDRAALHAELAASREQFAAIEREYQATVDAIRRETTAEVERILAAARQPWAAEPTGHASTER